MGEYVTLVDAVMILWAVKEALIMCFFVCLCEFKFVLE